MASIKKTNKYSLGIFDATRSFGLLLFLTLFSIICSCSRATKKDVSDELDYKEIANQVLGNGVKFVENESDEFFLCIKESKEIGNKVSSYMVLTKGGEVLIPKSKVAGRIYWIGEELLKIDPIDRVPKTRADELASDVQDNSYVVNVKTNQRVEEPKSKI